MTLSKAPSSCADGNEEGAQNQSTSRGSCFCCGASVQAAERLQGDVSLKSIMLDTLAKGQSPKTRPPPPPKRPAQTQHPPLYNKKPNQILGPRAEVGVTRVKVIYLGNMLKSGGKGRGVKGLGCL